MGGTTGTRTLKSKRAIALEEKRCDICGSVFPTFKGIKDTTVSLQSVAGASVFAFVGLNESGKTTILEAIHSFSPDDATSELLGGAKEVGVPFSERVPRHQLSNFTGDLRGAGRG